MTAAEVISNVQLPGLGQQRVDIHANLNGTGPAPLLAGSEAVHAKYREERDKRLKLSGGVEQYRSIEAKGQFSKYLKDPWSEPITRDAVKEIDDVVVIGGGYGAQLVAVKLLEAGITNFRLVEKAGDFGGTWYWNRYPGAACDIESYIYMPLLEETGYVPTEKYTKADELFAHAQRIGRKFGLYERTLFQTEVHALRWNDESGLWSVETSRNDDIKARFVIPVAGPLHRPKLPGVEGIEDFKGHSFHSSRWDFGYTGGDGRGGLTRLGDKRVAVLGTGATAVQIVPSVARYAKELLVFQRTPSAINVRNNRPTDPEWAASLKPGWQKERQNNFETIVNGGNVSEDLVKDGWTLQMHQLVSQQAGDPVKAAAARELADLEMMNAVRARTDEIVKDKATADALKPWYNVMCKRPCFHDEYLQAFNQENVRLIDTKGAGLERITEKGIVANGQEFEVDCIVYATGFETAAGFTHRSGMDIYGREGQRLSEAWRDGTSTLHGWTAPGFPNCFWIQQTQATISVNGLYPMAYQAAHLAYVIRTASERKIRTLEATQEATSQWVRSIKESSKLKEAFYAECTPGYYNNEGQSGREGFANVTYAGGSQAFLEVLADWRSKGDLEGLDARYF